MFKISRSIPAPRLQLFPVFHLIRRPNSGSRQQYDRLHVPWDNSVNKNAVIYSAHTTLCVRNMPLITTVYFSLSN